MKSDLEQMARDIWRRPSDEPIADWAAKNVRLVYSAVAPEFSVATSPWLAEPLAAVKEHTVRQINLLASIQSSKTTFAEVTLAWIIANRAGPTLWLDQTDENAKDQAESRLHLLFENCEPVRRLFPSNRHSKRKQTIHFPHMTLWVLSGHNRSNLQRRSVMWLLADEVWDYPYGHIREARARLTAFGWRSKMVLMGQGGEAGSEWEEEWEACDQREWTFACPKCGVRQAWDWANLEWDKAAKEGEKWNYNQVRATVRLKCKACGELMPDTDATRRQLNATGAYEVMNPNPISPGLRGYHWNQLACRGWGDMAVEYLVARAAQRLGDDEPFKIFVQKKLARFFTPDMTDHKVELLLGDYLLGPQDWEKEGKVEGVKCRVMTVDVQRDHFYFVIRSWAPDGSSRLIGRDRVATWGDLDAAQQRFGVFNQLVFCDARYNTDVVYHNTARRKWYAIMGDDRKIFAHQQGKRKGAIFRYYSEKQRVRLRDGMDAMLFMFAVLPVKDTLHRLRQNLEGAPRWELPADVGEDYANQMHSEVRVVKNKKPVWDQVGHRPNHYWDCETMQTAVAYMFKLLGREAVEDPGHAEVVRDSA